MSNRKPHSFFTNPCRISYLQPTQSSFDQVVQSLHLMPEQYAASPELKAWVKRNKKDKRTNSFSALKVPLDDVEQILHADTGVENPNHVLDGKSSLYACVSQLFNGSLQHWLLHLPTSHCGRV